MNGTSAPRPTPAIGVRGGVLFALHILLGAGLLAVGTVLRLRGGVPFLVFGGLLLAIGIGLAAGRSWAWWCAEIGHPLFVVGDAAVLVLSLVIGREAWKAEGMGRLAVFVMAVVFIVTLLAAAVSVATWFYLRRPAVREMYFRSNPKVPGSPPLPSMKGLGLAVSILVFCVAAVAAWTRAFKVPRPPGARSAHLQPRPAGKAPSSAVAQEPCASPYLSASVAFSPDAARLVGNTVRTLCVWDAATGRLLFSIPSERSESFRETAISPDGRYLATLESRGRDPGQIVLRELATGRRASAPSVPIPPVRAQKPFLAFGPNAATLIAQTDVNAVQVFDTGSGSARFTWNVEGDEVIRPVELAPSRKQVAFAANGRGPVRIADVETGQVRSFDLTPAIPAPASHARSPSSAQGEERIESILFSRDERTLFLGRFRSLAVVDLERWRERPSLELPPGSRSGSLIPLSISADGSRLLTEMPGFLLPIFHLPDGALVTLGEPRVRVGSERAPLFVEGKLTSSGGWGRVVGVDGRVISVALSPHETSTGGSGNREMSTKTWARSVSPDGSLLALDIDALSNLTLWNAATDDWVDLLSKPGSYGPMVQPVFSPDGRLLAVSGSHGIDMWSVPERKLLYRLGGKDRI